MQGSQGDGTTKPTAAAGNVSSTTGCVPTRIHSVTAEYLKHMHYLYQSHDLWDQADTMIDDKGKLRGDVSCYYGRCQPCKLNQDWDDDQQCYAD